MRGAGEAPTSADGTSGWRPLEPIHWAGGGRTISQVTPDASTAELVARRSGRKADLILLIDGRIRETPFQGKGPAGHETNVVGRQGDKLNRIHAWYGFPADDPVHADFLSFPPGRHSS